MSTCTSAGGVPLGVVITSSESEEVITKAMTFLKKFLPTNAFYGKGLSGPEICITDDSDAERAALGNTCMHFSSFAELVVMVVGCKVWHS